MQWVHWAENSYIHTGLKCEVACRQGCGRSSLTEEYFSSSLSGFTGFKCGLACREGCGRSSLTMASQPWSSCGRASRTHCRTPLPATSRVAWQCLTPGTPAVRFSARATFGITVNVLGHVLPISTDVEAAIRFQRLVYSCRLDKHMVLHVVRFGSKARKCQEEAGQHLVLSTRLQFGF